MRYIPCALCGTLMEFSSTKRTFYCSQKCKQRAYRERNRLRLAKSYEGVKGYCRNCGTEFITRQPKKQFCQTSCRVSFWQQQKRLKKFLETGRA